MQETQANSDFIAEQKHFRQRYQAFYKYFVHGGDSTETQQFAECAFISDWLISIIKTLSLYYNMSLLNIPSHVIQQNCL